MAAAAKVLWIGRRHLLALASCPSQTNCPTSAMTFWALEIPMFFHACGIFGVRDIPSPWEPMHPYREGSMHVLELIFTMSSIPTSEKTLLLVLNVVLFWDLHRSLVIRLLTHSLKEVLLSSDMRRSILVSNLFFFPPASLRLEVGEREEADG